METPLVTLDFSATQPKDFTILPGSFADTTIEIEPISDKAREYVGAGVASITIAKSMLDAWVAHVAERGLRA